MPCNGTVDARSQNSTDCALVFVLTGFWKSHTSYWFKSLLFIRIKVFTCVKISMIIQIFLHAFESNISNRINLKIVSIEKSDCCRNEDVYLIFLDCENSCIILALMV